jgi:hypothetical protein
MRRGSMGWSNGCVAQREHAAWLDAAETTDLHHFW